ncbi:unnamed protein product [Urochloa humidicola]
MAGPTEESSAAQLIEEERLAAEAAKAERAKAREAALERAVAAERLADAAAKERAAAAVCLCEALALAAQEHAAADTADPPPPPPSVHDDKKPADVNDAMLLHEAAAVLNLHAQAVAVQNIRSLIPIVLDITADNYIRWREQFLLTVGKFSLEDHVLLDDTPVGYPDWTRMDCVVRSWIYSTISNDLVETVMESDASAHAVWAAVESQFMRKEIKLN